MNANFSNGCGMKRVRTGYQIQKSNTTAALIEEWRAEQAGEDRIHASIVEYAKNIAPLQLVFWHTPNGGKRPPRTAVRLKQLGTLAGVCDLIFSLPERRMLFMEVKTKTGRVSPEQKRFLDMMQSHGHETCVVRSLNDAVAVLNQFGAIAGKIAA